MVRKHSNKKLGGNYDGLLNDIEKYRKAVNNNIRIDTENAGYCDADCNPHMYYDQDDKFTKLGGKRRKKSKSRRRYHGGMKTTVRPVDFPTDDGKGLFKSVDVDGKVLSTKEGDLYPIQMHPSVFPLATKASVEKYTKFLHTLNDEPLMRVQFGGKKRKSKSKRKAKKSKRFH